ncbi:MAG: PIN domain-containing protein [Chloroflexi bacterium]|nr:PIN domain-containing protein [Chloroflexota bacterium]
MFGRRHPGVRRDRLNGARALKRRSASTALTPDALIAATALERGLQLVTRRRDFDRVADLRLRDPGTLQSMSR